MCKAGRFWPTALTIGFILTASGCNQQSQHGASPLPPAPTSLPSSPHRSAPLEAISAYLRMRAVETQILNNPARGTTELQTVAAGQALTVLQAEISASRKQGIKLTGTMRHRPEVEWESPGPPPSVTIRDCVDITDLQAVGRAQLPSQAPRYVATATITKTAEAKWIVTSIQADRSRSC